jgi:hypothetical protein
MMKTLKFLCLILLCSCAAELDLDAGKLDIDTFFIFSPFKKIKKGLKQIP